METRQPRSRKSEAREQRLVQQLEGFKSSARGGVLEGVDWAIVEKGAVREWKRKAENFGKRLEGKRRLLRD